MTDFKHTKHKYSLEQIALLMQNHNRRHLNRRKVALQSQCSNLSFQCFPSFIGLIIFWKAETSIQQSKTKMEKKSVKN